MIRHILKNGQEVASVEGLLIKAAEFPTLYQMVSEVLHSEASDARQEIHTAV